MINHKFIFFSAVQVYDHHIFICILHLLRVSYELTMWPAPRWLSSSVGIALHWFVWLCSCFQRPMVLWTLAWVLRLVLVCLHNDTLFLAEHGRLILRMLSGTFCLQFFIQIQIPTSRFSARASLSGSCPSSLTTRSLTDVIPYLMGSSFQPSSLPTYRRVWRLYNTFSIDILGQSACPLPLSPSSLAIFIVYLYQHGSTLYGLLPSVWSSCPLTELVI